MREIGQNEAELLYDLDSDPEVMKFLKGGATTELKDCQKAIISIRGYYEKYSHNFGIWFAEEKLSGEFMGWFLLRPDKNNQDDLNNPELGYRLKKKFWGKGYATEGSLALVNKAFNELTCDTVYAVTMSGNTASRNVMKKVGMEFTGDYAQDECFAPGNDSSAVKYVISKEQWELMSKIN